MACIKLLLLPFSLIYGLAVGTRNILFNMGVLKSKSFDTPVICVGNITVGGTGKTPHTELIIRELKKKFHIACLSRGYKRKTTGFILADKQSTAQTIGDEPMQIKNKFPDILVACDGNRVRGIHQLLNLQSPPEVIVLDDAFQHRYVQAGKNILLVDYNRPVHKDHLLPFGRLRENTNALKRADYIIVTKCPANLQPIERRLLYKHLKIKPYQQLYFTILGYGEIKSLSQNTIAELPTPESRILCITGIATPKPYIEHLETFTKNITHIAFSDHHHFSKKDIKQIEQAFQKMKGANKYIFTTEKDAVRLQTYDLPKSIRKSIYYIPIIPIFLQNGESFLNEISEYVRKNKK